MTCISQLNNLSISLRKADLNNDGNIITSTFRDSKHSTNKTELALLMKDIGLTFQIGKHNSDSIQEILRYLDSLDDEDQCSNNNECGDGIIILRGALSFIEKLKTDKSTRDTFIEFLNTTINSYKSEKRTKRNMHTIGDLQKVITLVQDCECRSTDNSTYITNMADLSWYLLNK
jgi:hypothetical protein